MALPRLLVVVMGKRYNKKRIKRAYLKRFSAAMVNVGKGPSRNAIPQEFEGIADYRKRGGSFEPIPSTKSNTLGPEGIQGQQSHFVDPVHQVIYENGQYRKLRLMFAGSLYQWELEDLIVRRISRSIVYRSKAAAERAYELSASRTSKFWVEIIKLPRPG
jgi:hypothetical protein